MSEALEPIAPGADAILRLVLEQVKPGRKVLVLGSGQGALTGLLAGYAGAENVFDESSGDAIDAVDAFDVAVCFQPSRLGPLLQVMRDLHEALGPEGRAVVSDVVWQTAPPPDVARAFAPPPGREKVRPIEGYEMQLDHAAFEILERLDFGRDEWLAHLRHHPGAGAQAAAIAADERGAARYSAWLLKKA